MPSGRTHFTAGIVASGFAIYMNGGPLGYSLVGGLAALLPDIDHKSSLFGRLTPLHRFFRHRGFTHSLFALCLVAYSLIIMEVNEWLFICITWGYLSHLVLDWNVPWLWPKGRRRRR